MINGNVTAQERLRIAGQAGTSGSISGITWNYDVTSGVMTLTGTAAISTYESVLRQVTYQNTGATPTTAARDIQFTLGTLLYNPDNQHYYDFVTDTNNISWTAARDAAASSKQFGLQGYLATITSQAENDLVANKLRGNGWIGASDAETEGVWKWVTGPEAGTQFWQGNSADPNATLQPGQSPGELIGDYANWSSKYIGGADSYEPNNLKYEDGTVDEDYAHFLYEQGSSETTGKWNDYPNSVEGRDGIKAIQGYVVEYGGMPGDTSPLQITGTARVTFDQANPNPINPGSSQTSTWDFVTRDLNLDNTTDIVAIKKNGTPNGMTEVHIMNATNKYQSWGLQTKTILHQTDNTWDFAKGDVNRDGHADIVAIKKSGAPNGLTEVHIMNAADNYKSWVLQTPTVLHATDDTWDFQAADYNGDGYTDLIGFKKSGTTNGKTEVHILDGKTNYQTFSLQAETALHQTGDNFEFQVGDYNGDGLMDIVAIKKSDTPNGMTEVHILDGASNFKTFSLNTETALHQTPSGWNFLMDDYNSNSPMGIISLKETDTGSNTTEAHVLNGGTIYQSWLMQTPTVLHE